jgi:MFS family permease
MQPPSTDTQSRSGLVTRSQARLLWPLGAAMALSLTGDSTMYAVLPNQIETVGISLGVVGVLLGANRMIRIPGNLLAGALNDRLGRRRLFLLGLLLGILSSLSYSVARGFWPLLAGRILWGIAWALINVGGYTMIIDSSTPADRGRMTGFYQMAFMIGLSISPILGGALTDVLGFRRAMQACAVVSAAGMGVALAVLPETMPPDSSPHAELWLGPARQWLRQLSGGLREVDPQILRADAIYLLVLFVNSGVLMSTVSLYLKLRWGENVAFGGLLVGVASLSGAMLTLRALMGIVAGPLAGPLSDRLQSRWPVVRGAILLGMAGFIVLALLPGFVAVPLGVAVVALSAGALAASLAAIVGDTARRDRPGVTMASLATAGDIGSATGPLIAYWLAATFDLRWVYLLCALALACGLALSRPNTQSPMKSGTPDSPDR